MSFKRILLPVNDKDDIAPIADFAFALADQHKAEVRGIFPQDDVNKNFWLDNYGLSENAIEESELLREKKAAEAARRAEKKFEAHAKRYKKINAKHISTFGDIGTSLLDHAFCSDVVVLGNTTHQGSQYWRLLADHLLVQSTKPVIVAPSRPVPKELGNRIVLAWKHSPEASRAIAAAMPLIEKADEALIVTVGESDDWMNVEALKSYISLHNRNVETAVLSSGGGDIGNLLVKKAAEQPGSILVMGAFSHHRWRERVFGGVTEYILHNTDVPVLMMH